MTDAYLPDGWESNRFGEVIVGKPQYGLTARSSTEVNDVVYLRISDITDDGSLKRDEIHYLDRGRAELDKYGLHENDFLIARTGASVGRVYLHKDFGGPSVFASYLIRFKLDAEKVLPKFVLYWGLSSDFKKEIESRAKIAAQPNVNAKDYCRFRIQVPPLSAQKRICDILDRVKDLRRNREQANQLTGKIIQSVFFKMFGDPRRNSSMGFQTTPLDDLVENLDSKRVPLNEEQRSKRRGGLPYYGASGLVGRINDLLFDEPLLLVAEDGENLRSRSLPIAYSIFGKSWVNNHAHVLRCLKIDQRFLEFWFNQLDISPYLGGSTRPKMNKTTLMAIDVPIPPQNLQMKFAETVNKIEAMRRRQLQSTQEINELTQSLMQKAFSGKLPAIRVN